MKKRVVGVIVSVALAAFGTFVLLSWVNSAEERAAAGEAVVEVLVVNEPIAKGMPASELASKVRPALVPAKVQAPGAVASLDEVQGMLTSVDLLPGEQLIASRFVTEESLIEVREFEIPDGYLQVTVSLSPERAVGGSIAPGDTVAFFASFEPFTLDTVEPADDLQAFLGDTSSSDDARALRSPNSTHLILHKLLVTGVQVEKLPSDQARESAEETGVTLAPTGNLLVTLAVPAPDAEKIVFTAEHGTAWLAFEPIDASEAGTEIQTRGTIYR